MPFKHTATPSSNRLYRNNGNKTFTDVGAAAGVDDDGGGTAAVWGDCDNDGDLDLYVTNNTPFASIQRPNRLYRNNGNGSFTEIGAAAGVDDNQVSAGAAWGDYDNDGDLDLYVARTNGKANLLYQNQGNCMFTEVGATAKVDDTGEALGVAWGDYDNDGDLDLNVGIHRGPNRLYRNDGNGMFTEVASNPGINVNDSGGGRGVAWGDYDKDGDLDFYVANDHPSDGIINRLFQNTQNDDNYLFVRPLDGQGRFNRHGATVRVFEAGTTDLVGMRSIDGGSGYFSQNAYDAHFGLEETGLYDIEVTFPGGFVVDKGIVPGLGNFSPLTGHFVQVNQIPEPATFILFLVGIGGTALYGVRRRRKPAA